MRLLSCIRVETGRLLRTKITWLVAVLTILSPYVVSQVYKSASEITRAGMYLANFSLAGAFSGTILFAFLTLVELDRAHRASTDALTDSILSPLLMSIARLCAVMLITLGASLLTMACYLPFTMEKLGNVFSLWDFIASYAIFMLLGIWLGCLLAAALYQITRRVDASFVVFAAWVLFCCSDFARERFLLRWINPIVPIFSDDFSNAQPLLMAAYNRLVYLLGFGGLWVFSVLCVRQFGLGLLPSLLRNMRRVYAPVLTCILLFSAGLAWANQPFVNDAPKIVNAMPMKSPESVELLSTDVKARPNLWSGTQHGTAAYRLRNRHGESVAQRFSLNSGYKVKSLTVDGVESSFTDLKNDMTWFRQVEFALPPGENIEVVVEYGGFPKMWSAVEAYMGGDEVSKRYIYLMGPSFAPVMDAHFDIQECELVAQLTLPGNLMPVIFGQGEAVLQETAPTGEKSWQLQAKGPMLYLYAADYERVDVSIPELTIEFYFSRKHREIMERVGIADTLRQVAQYATNTIGPLRFAQDGKLKLMQVSAYLGGGYAGDGMSVMGESSFVEEGLRDPLRGASGQEVMAHEILHQWWGLGLMFAEGTDPEWSAEGFTVYSTYRLMKEKYGEDYARKFYVEMWRAEAEKLERDFYHRHPEYLDKLPQQYVDTIRSHQYSTMTYCVMPLKILKAAELLGGEEKMDEVMRGLFEKGHESMQPLTYDAFLEACDLKKEQLAL